MLASGPLTEVADRRNELATPCIATDSLHICEHVRQSSLGMQNCGRGGSGPFAD
jgi:hypothetical protein